jgi:hypothetical protein
MIFWGLCVVVLFVAAFAEALRLSPFIIWSRGELKHAGVGGVQTPALCSN